MTNYSSTLQAWALFSTHGSLLSENKAGFMAAGKGGKHNKACSSLEFNAPGLKTEYRYQRPGLREKKNCSHNVENTSTGHTRQVIYNVVFLLLSLNLEHPGGTVRATGREGGTREQFTSTMAVRANMEVHKVYKRKRWNWYKMILTKESELKDVQSTALCDQIEALQSQGVDTVHWSRLRLCLPQWSNYRMSCYHILPITNVLSRTHRLIFSFYPSIRVWLIRHLAWESKTHPIDFFLVYIFTHTLMQLGAQSPMVSALLGAHSNKSPSPEVASGQDR